VARAPAATKLANEAACEIVTFERDAAAPVGFAALGPAC
jgi:hypothetical protein